jgi:putative transcriptional regulator
MGIDVQLRRETGEVLQEVGDSQMVLSRATHRAFAGTCLLKYVVPWGDAIFNQAQALPETDMTDIPELTAKQLARAIPASVRKRLMQGRFESGADIAALRRFVGLTQARFARAMGISGHTLRNWEQDRRSPEGPALALLRIAARHPRILRENLKSAA